MKSHSYSRLFLAALVMAIVFVISEFIIEGFAKAVLGVTEESYLQDIHLSLNGFRYHLVNIAYFYSFCCLTMWLYGSLLAKYVSLKHTVPATTLFLLALVFLTTVNMVNIGLIPFAAGLTSFIFNALELVPAIVVGANVYSAGDKSNN
jgi:hypothetical protein